MPQVNQTITTQTNQGEITINLNLVLTIQTDGSIGVSAVVKPKKEEEKVVPIWDFGNDDLIEFGKEGKV